MHFGVSSDPQLDLPFQLGRFMDEAGTGPALTAPSWPCPVPCARCALPCFPNSPADPTAFGRPTATPPRLRPSSPQWSSLLSTILASAPLPSPALPAA
jgi:hypothetical protein